MEALGMIGWEQGQGEEWAVAGGGHSWGHSSWKGGKGRVRQLANAGVRISSAEEGTRYISP